MEKIADAVSNAPAGGLGLTLAELRVAAATAKVAVSALNWELKSIIRDPARTDYQFVTHTLNSLDLSALQNLLGSTALDDASLAMIRDLLAAVDAANVVLAAAERSQGALISGDIIAYGNQTEAFQEGIDALQRATNAFGRTLAAWERQMQQAGIPNFDLSQLTIDYTLLTQDDLAQIRSDLLSLGLGDAATVDALLSLVLNGPAETFSGSVYENLDSLIGPLSTLPALDAQVDLPNSLLLLILGTECVNENETPGFVN